MMALLSPVVALMGEWKGIPGAIVVAVSAVLLIGSVYMLLWSIYGAKQGYLVMMVSLFIFMILLSAIWLFGAPGTTPGTGPRGPEPTWVPFLATSEQAQDFPAVQRFPSGWDPIGKTYGGGVDSKGEIETIRSIVTTALAQRAQSQGLTTGTEPADYAFRASEKAETPDDAKRPLAQVRFTESGSRLLAGIRLPATDKHPEITVFVFRDKSRVFQYAAIFLGVSVVGFFLHLAGLARYEMRRQPMEASV